MKIKNKFLVIIIFLFLSLCTSVTANDGDVYYFTDTDISWDDTQFNIIITMFLFTFFFWIGYISPKRSGGSFMLLSGFILLALEGLLSSILDPLLIIPLITPFAIFIIFLGIRKQFYPMENEKTKSESG